MSENGNAADSTHITPALPKCSSCGMQPLGFAENRIQTSGGLIVGLLWCVKCGQVLTCSILGMKEIIVRDPTRKDGGVIKLA